MFNIENRRYVGNKYKLMDWIKEVLKNECKDAHSFFDVFAGTGVVTNCMLDCYDIFIINDFLYSNEVIYHAFFGNGNYRKSILDEIKAVYNSLDKKNLQSNYFSEQLGDKFFSIPDAKAIGYIRDDIEKKKEKNEINNKEYNILLSSLLYSSDRIANTCGHYDAYIKGKQIRSDFLYDLIQPLDIGDKKIFIHRRDANLLVKNVDADIAFIDPPYNSRQYSRFYHVLENLTKWEKPKLYGVAMKPKEENMSEYCRSSAPIAFADLIKNLNTNYIVVTYNNTYTSKSMSSQNKISLKEITKVLEEKGETIIYEKPYRFFNTGKTDFSNHKEYLFVTKVN